MFEYRRENHSSADYLTQFRLYYDEAQDLGGLVLNDVAKSYLLLRNSGLPKRVQDEFRLKTDGDLAQFNRLYQLLNRYAKSEVASSSCSTPALINFGESAVYHADEDGEVSEYDEPVDQSGSWSDCDGNS